MIIKLTTKCSVANLSQLDTLIKTKHKMLEKFDKCW